MSDEVGLGKTIEAGLVLKEYLTRGRVCRFLALTVPSLVDQWAEELESKFSLASVTSNQPQLAQGWKNKAPLGQSWERKTFVLPALSRTEGGLVIFTQFLATQRALAEALASAGVRTWTLNGQTPRGAATGSC